MGSPQGKLKAGQVSPLDQVSPLRLLLYFRGLTFVLFSLLHRLRNKGIICIADWCCRISKKLPGRIRGIPNTGRADAACVIFLMA